MKVDDRVQRAIEDGLVRLCIERNVVVDVNRLNRIQARIERRLENNEPDDLVFSEETRDLK